MLINNEVVESTKKSTSTLDNQKNNQVTVLGHVSTCTLGYATDFFEGATGRPRDIY